MTIFFLLLKGIALLIALVVGGILASCIIGAVCLVVIALALRVADWIMSP